MGAGPEAVWLRSVLTVAAWLAMCKREVGDLRIHPKLK